MDRIIRQITDRLVDRLPENKNYYRIQNLSEYDFPSFLVHRMQIELEWNLAESMILPKTDWANTQSHSVQQSWQHFLDAIHAEVQLPASYARAVIETAVADVIEILIQPRKNIPEILFGGEKKLSRTELSDRTELLVVYPHFARVLVRYMERKNKDALTLEQCRNIISRVDEKLTRSYTPLQWAQMLDPFFTLAGKEIESNHFRLFFEDKKMHRSARTFDMMNSTISRAEFIEVLSSPKLLNYDGYEEDQSELFNEDEDAEDNPEEDSKQFQGEDASTQGDQNKQHTQMVEKPAEVDEASQKVNADDSSAENEVFETEETDKETSSKPITPSQMDDKKQKKDPTDIEAQEQDDGPSSVSLNNNFENDDDEESAQSMHQVEEFSDKSEENVTAEDAPIWMRFMDDEDESVDQPTDEPAEQNDDDITEQEPIIDLTESDEATAKPEELEELLAGDEDYFVEELFDGSERAYQESLREIAEKNTWKNASKLIEQNIFKRNMIDVYSEAAVDFTDQLHTYFIKKQHSK